MAVVHNRDHTCFFEKILIKHTPKDHFNYVTADLKTNTIEIQVDVVLLLKTRCHTILSRLITHVYVLNTVYYNNVLKIARFCNAFINRV